MYARVHKMVINLHRVFLFVCVCVTHVHNNILHRRRSSVAILNFLFDQKYYIFIKKNRVIKDYSYKEMLISWKNVILLIL